MPTARILRLHARTFALPTIAPDHGDWTARERRRIGRLRTLCAANQGWDLGYGCADAGDPWCIVHDREGDVVVHIARIGRRYVVAWAQGQQLARFASLKAAVDLVLGLYCLKTSSPSPAPTPPWEWCDKPGPQAA
jgi:hypothetical protein